MSGLAVCGAIITLGALIVLEWFWNMPNDF